MKLRAIIFGVTLLSLLTGIPRMYAQEQAPAEGEYLNFSFEDVDLRLLVKLVGEKTGKRFILDESVQGKVSVVTPKPISVAEAYPLLVSVLESSGYTVVMRESAHHVVPLPKRSIPEAPVLGTDEHAVLPGMVSKLFQLEHLSALDVKKALEPMVASGKEGGITAFTSANHLLITDTGENIRRIERIIDELDRAGISRVIEVIPLEHASADELAEQLVKALAGAGRAGARLNRHMQQVAQGGGGLPAETMVVPAPHANSLVIAGSPDQISELKAIITSLDVEPSSPTGRLNVIMLKYLDVEEAVKSLKPLLESPAGSDQPARVRIEASVPNNALLVEAAPAEFDRVKALVEQIDQIPQQVLVEVLIAEASLGNNFELGLEWASIEAPQDGSTTFIGRQNLNGQNLISNLATNLFFGQGLTLSMAKGTFSLPDGSIVPSIPVLLNAMAEDRDIKILSNVPLWAQNNKEASVSVVENIPILRSTIEGGSGTARDVIQNIDRMDVGLKLSVTPHVNPDGEITLELKPSIEAIVDEGPDGSFAPTIARREVSTTVTIPNETTVAITGLIREDEVEQITKIPFMGDLPFIGPLFRSTARRSQRTNLLIFVTPHLVTDPARSAELADKLKDKTGLREDAESMFLDAPISPRTEP